MGNLVFSFSSFFMFYFIQTNATATLKKFVPRCCSVIGHLTSVEGVAEEEEVDGQLLWNLQILSEVVRSSGSLQYKDKLIAAINSTIHLKCKEAATLGAILLEHMLRPLAKICPMEWRSVLVDFGTPPTEHLFIREIIVYFLTARVGLGKTRRPL